MLDVVDCGQINKCILHYITSVCRCPIKIASFDPLVAQNGLFSQYVFTLMNDPFKIFVEYIIASLETALPWFIDKYV